MLVKLGISVWALGRTRVVTFTEYDDNTRATYRITYPIDYSEGSDLASWARRRIVAQDCEFYLAADGWDVYIPIDKVIDPSVLWAPLHTNTRTNPKMTPIYESLTQGHHSVMYNAND